MMYGNVMACGKSYQSAIGRAVYPGFTFYGVWLIENDCKKVYYLRAYDLRPDDPLVCLTLALAYAHRAMQRQTDNRHYQLAQVR